MCQDSSFTYVLDLDEAICKTEPEEEVDSTSYTEPKDSESLLSGKPFRVQFD